jgi:hypothetical protein
MDGNKMGANEILRALQKLAETLAGLESLWS